MYTYSCVYSCIVRSKENKKYIIEKEKHEKNLIRRGTVEDAIYGYCEL